MNEKIEKNIKNTNNINKREKYIKINSKQEKNDQIIKDKKTNKETPIKNVKKSLNPIFITKIISESDNNVTTIENKYPVINSQFINATTFLKREPVFSTHNNCLYKAILTNLEISSFFHLELRQFIVKFIEERKEHLLNCNITEEELIDRKNNILKDENVGTDIDLIIVGNYLEINIVILNNDYIVKKIFYNNDNLYLNLYFIEEEGENHIEPLTQYKLLDKFHELKCKVSSLVNILVTFNEKNKDIKIVLEDDKNNINKTIPELDNLSLNLFRDTNPVVNYKIKNVKKFNELLKYSKVVSHEDLCAQINATSAVGKRIKLSRIAEEDMENNELSDNVNDNDLLKIQAKFIQNIICSRCSKIVDYDGEEFQILKYYENYRKFSSHIKDYHKNLNKNELGIDMKFFKTEYSFIKKDGKNNYCTSYLINTKLINKLDNIFGKIDEPESLEIGKKEIIENDTKDKTTKIEKKHKREPKNTRIKSKIFDNELNIMLESEIQDLIKNLIPNFISDLPNELFFLPDEIFTQEEINKYGLFIIKNDIAHEDFVSFDNYKELMKYPYYSCGSCNFIDKFGNFNLKFTLGFASYKRHCKIHCKYLKKGTMIFKKIPEQYIIIKSDLNDKMLYGIVNESINLINEEIKKKQIENYSNKISTYGNKEKPKGIDIIGWNCVALGTTHNLFLFNKYLEEQSPDFILLNEIGNYNKNALKLNEKYDCIIHSKNVGLVYNRKYKTTKICGNLLDEYTLIKKFNTNKKINH